MLDKTIFTIQHYIEPKKKPIVVCKILQNGRDSDKSAMQDD